MLAPAEVTQAPAMEPPRTVSCHPPFVYKSEKLTQLCKMPHRQYFGCLRQPITAVINDPLNPLSESQLALSSLPGTESGMSRLLWPPFSLISVGSALFSGAQRISVPAEIPFQCQLLVRTTRASAVKGKY